MRTLLRRIHLIASLIAGLWLAISALSGSALVFGDRLDRAVHPDLFGSGSSGADLDRVVAVSEAASGMAARRVRLASDQSPAHEVWLGCDHCVRAWVDPVGGAVLGLRTPSGTTRGLLHELHRRMLSGRSGEIAVGVGGIALLTLSLTGFFIYAPAGRWRQAFRLRFTSGWKRANFDFHRVSGLLVLPLLIATAASGVYFVFHGPFDRLAARIDRVERGASQPIISGAVELPLSHLVEQVRRRFPEARVTWITLPADEGQPLVVRVRQRGENHPNGRTFVRVDPYSGEHLEVVDAFEAPLAGRALSELYPLHVGETGGVAHKVLLLVAGLAVPVLFVSGLLAWWNRSLRRRIAPRLSTTAVKGQIGRIGQEPPRLAGYIPETRERNPLGRVSLR